MDPEMVAAIAQGAANSISGAVGTGLAAQSVSSYRKMADHQYYLQLRQWEKENEYNLPKNRMKRLVNAGLNPNLIYGSGVDTTSAPSPKYANPVMPRYQDAWRGLGDNIVSAYQNAEQIKTQRMVAEAQKELLASDKNNKDAANPGIVADSLSKIVRSDVDQETKQDLIENIKTNTEIAKENLVKTREETLSQQLSNQHKGIEIETLRDKIGLEIENLRKTGKNIDASTYNLYKSADRTVKEVNKLNKEIDLLQWDIDSKPSAGIVGARQDQLQEMARQSAEMQYNLLKEAYENGWLSFEQFMKAMSSVYSGLPNITIVK